VRTSEEYHELPPESSGYTGEATKENHSFHDRKVLLKDYATVAYNIEGVRYRQANRRTEHSNTPILIYIQSITPKGSTKTHTHTHNLPTPGLTMGSAKRSRINGIRHRIYNDTDTASGKHKSLRMYQTGERRTVNPKAYMGKTYQWLH